MNDIHYSKDYDSEHVACGALKAEAKWGAPQSATTCPACLAALKQEVRGGGFTPIKIISMEHIGIDHSGASAGKKPVASARPPHEYVRFTRTFDADSETDSFYVEIRLPLEGGGWGPWHKLRGGEVEGLLMGLQWVWKEQSATNDREFKEWQRQRALQRVLDGDEVVSAEIVDSDALIHWAPGKFGSVTACWVEKEETKDGWIQMFGSGVTCKACRDAFHGYSDSDEKIEP
jgi:hypothetical protein